MNVACGQIFCQAWGGRPICCPLERGGSDEYVRGPQVGVSSGFRGGKEEEVEGARLRRGAGRGIQLASQMGWFQMVNNGVHGANSKTAMWRMVPKAH